jgi:hypothetical protein
MPGSKSFLDSLKNLRLVMSVALEHMQENRDQFLKDATGSQVRQFEKSISQIRTFADRIETEFNTLEYFRRSIRRSATRCSMNFMVRSWLMLSKKPGMSASSTQFTRFHRRFSLAGAKIQLY